MSSLWTPHSGSSLAYVLVYALAAAFVVIILEMNIKTNILVSLLRRYFFILHGTWIFQVGVIIYYPVFYTMGSGELPQFNEDFDIVYVPLCSKFYCHGGHILLISRIYKQKDTTDCRYKKLETNDVSDNEIC